MKFSSAIAEAIPTIKAAPTVVTASNITVIVLI